MEIGLIVKNANGDFYSTSPSGGKNNDNGTIFKISAETHQPEVLYSFDFTEHGGRPLSGLSTGRQFSDGKGGFVPEPHYYGATYHGGLFVTGTLNGQPTKKLGTGTIFKFKPGDVAPEIIHTFRNGDLTGIKPEICPESSRAAIPFSNASMQQRAIPSRSPCWHRDSGSRSNELLLEFPLRDTLQGCALPGRKRHNGTVYRRYSSARGPSTSLNSPTPSFGICACSAASTEVIR